MSKQMKATTSWLFPVAHPSPGFWHSTTGNGDDPRVHLAVSVGVGSLCRVVPARALEAILDLRKSRAPWCRCPRRWDRRPHACCRCSTVFERSGVLIDGLEPSKVVQQAFCSGCEWNSRQVAVPPYDSGHSFGMVVEIVEQ